MIWSTLTRLPKSDMWSVLCSLDKLYTIKVETAPRSAKDLCASCLQSTVYLPAPSFMAVMIASWWQIKNPKESPMHETTRMTSTTSVRMWMSPVGIHL